MCLYIDDDDHTNLHSGFRRARKAHECLECRRPIEPGESYWSQTSVDHWSNSVVTWKMCGHCRTLITVGAQLTGCPENWYWEMVLDLCEEGYGFAQDILSHDLPAGARFRFLRLMVLARRQWRDRTGVVVDLPQVEAVA